MKNFFSNNFSQWSLNIVCKKAYDGYPGWWVPPSADECVSRLPSSLQ